MADPYATSKATDASDPSAETEANEFEKVLLAHGNPKKKQYDDRDATRAEKKDARQYLRLVI